LVSEASRVDGELITVTCAAGSTVGELRKHLVPLCEKNEGFAGEADISLKGEGGRRLFAAMSLDEAGIADGCEVTWQCKDRSGPPGQNAEPAECKAHKLYRLEKEFSGKAPRDPCADVTMEADKDSLNAREFEMDRKARGDPKLIPKRDPQEYIDMGF